MMSVFNGVSIIIPAINETHLLRRTIDIIADTCNKSDIAEIIFVFCDRTTPDCIKSANETIDEYISYPIKIYYQENRSKNGLQFVLWSFLLLLSLLRR